MFKIDLRSAFFQFSDRGQTVNRVSSEPTDRFCDDKIDTTRKGILNHLVETVSAPYIQARKALVRIHFYENPFRVAVDVIRVVVHLRLVTGELFIAVR